MRNKTKKVTIVLVIIIVFFSVKNNNAFNHQESKKGILEVQEKDIFGNLKKSGFWPNCPRIHIKNDNWSENTLDWIQVNSGTQNSPHIIENVTIDAGGIGSAILIENSSAFFIIRNCTLTNSGSGNNAGIFLNYTSNGQLVNNNCSNNNYHGICLHNKCINNIILNNTANNNIRHGIKLEINCTDNTILGNIAHSNGRSGIVLAQNCYNNSLLENEIKNNGYNGISLGSYSNNNTISGNIANDNDDYGISLSSHCDNNMISGNIANDNYYIGIYLYRYSNNNTISRNIVNNNRWWGINLDEYCDNNKVSGNIAYNNGLEGIYLTFYCDNNTISGNTANNNRYGIYIYYYCNDNIVLNNTVENNSVYGVRIYYYSNNNSVLENIINNNRYGVEVYYDCDDNRILGNTINNNEESGIYVEYESYNNIISGNKINNNKKSGIVIAGRDCDNTTILGNSLNNNHYGIYLVNIYRAELSGNTLKNCGIMVEGSLTQLSSHLIYSNNTVNERIIYYYVNKSGLGTVNFTGGGQVLLFYCDNSDISKLNVSHASIGIYLFRSSDVTISNNIANNNSQYGIYLYRSSNVTISNNVINNNTQYGIYIAEDCDDNTILENYLYFNSNWAVFISSANCDDNIIERNVLVSDNGKFIENMGNNTIIKLNIISNTPPSVLIEVIAESFSTIEFTITIKISCEIIGLEISDPYIQMWWDGSKVPSSNIVELGNGLYNISLSPIFINPGESPILLNMTISANYYLEKYFEIYIAVEKSEIVKLLQVEITENCYSLDHFNFTIFIFNESGQDIDSATIQMWWDGIDVSTDIENLGNGYYFISLYAITVTPGEDPILLNMTISASGYEDKYFETYIAVSPSDLEEDTLELEIFEQSFSTEHFNMTFFIFNETGYGIEFVTMQMWWNGVDVSSDVKDLGSGYYFVSLDAITVAPGEDPILLNMTISASGYEDKYFETYIAVSPSDLEEDTIELEIIDQSFSIEHFNITFFIHNTTGYGIEFATMQMWWNGVDVSSDVQNLGSGLYFISLDAITVAPGEDPILLNMTISASRYEDKYFETYIAVSPSDLIEDTLELEVIDQSFSTEQFNMTFFICNTTGYGIEFATIQMWWNGVEVSSDVQNLGGGYYFVSLDAITVAPGEDPILLNMTISASGYEDKYFETYIAVSPSDLEEDTLELEVIDQSFSTEQFNMTFFIHNTTGYGIDFATLQIWWNGVEVSSGVQNLGDGLYFISLESITVNPGEEPILLTIIISASGYEDKSFETYIAVDPASLLKGEGGPSDGFPLALTITIAATGTGAIIGVISIYWYKWRKRKSQ